MNEITKFRKGKERELFKILGRYRCNSTTSGPTPMEVHIAKFLGQALDELYGCFPSRCSQIKASDAILVKGNYSAVRVGWEYTRLAFHNKLRKLNERYKA